MDQTIHKLTVGHYTLDVRVSQLVERLATMEGTPLFHYSHFSSPANV